MSSDLLTYTSQITRWIDRRFGLGVAGDGKSVGPRSIARRRRILAALLNGLARLTLGATLVLIPFRFRYLLVSRPFPPVYRDYTDFLLFAPDIVMLAALVFWLGALALKPRRLTFGPLFLTIPVAGLAFLGLLSVPLSVDPLLSVYHVVRLIALGAFYLMVLNEVNSLDRLILPLGLMVVVQSVIGVEQVLQQSSLGLGAWGEYALNPDWNGVSVVTVAGERWLRAYGLSDHPNILGGCLAFGLILIAAWFCEAPDRWRPLGLGAFTVGALGLFFTYSRSAWLALVVGLALVFAWLVKTRSSSLVRWLGMLAAAFVVILPFLWQNAASLGVRLGWGGSFQAVPQEFQAIGERTLLNQAANQLFSVNALTGVGLGALPTAMSRSFPDFRADYQPAHFVLVDVAAEIGLFGALFYGVMVAAPWLALGLNRRRLNFSPALVGASALLAAVTLIGFFDYYTWLLVPGRLWTWFSWGLWAAVYRSSYEEAADG